MAAVSVMGDVGGSVGGVGKFGCSIAALLNISDVEHTVW